MSEDVGTYYMLPRELFRVLCSHLNHLGSKCMAATTSWLHDTATSTISLEYCRIDFRRHTEPDQNRGVSRSKEYE